MSVVDREALKEALEQHRLRGATTASEAAKAGIGTDLVRIERAARSVLEGEATKWCEVHKSSGNVACWRSYDHPETECSMVRVVVVPIGGE